MTKEINLVPENIIKKHGEYRRVKFIIVLEIFLMFVFSTVVGTLFVLNRDLLVKSLDLQTKIRSLENKIARMQLTANQGADFSARIIEIERVLENRQHLSIFISNFIKIVPSGVKVEKIYIGEKSKIIVGGTSVSYGVLADFLAVFGKEAKIKDSIYSDSALTEISLKKETGLISFTLEIGIKPESLVTKGIL
jgi:Tfp pilus assembly protein PilN